MNFLKKLFGPKEVKPVESGNTEIEVIATATTEEDQVLEESGATEAEEPVVEPVEEPVKEIDFHILLDNGHAKSTPGKRMKLENGRFFYEYEFNRDVVKRIADSLDELHIPYEILVPELEKDISLTDRAARANSFCTKYGKDKCLFISVHSNACGDGLTFNKAKGWSIYTTKGETKSDEIATTFFNVADEELPKYGFTTRKDITDGDPDYEENFTVIYKTWCPAVLTENLFFTNKEEVKWLMSEEGKQVIADIHVKAIKKIVESK